MIPLKWVVVLVVVVTPVTPVVSAVSSSCSWLIPSESGCVTTIDCQSDFDAIYIWEDCPAGGELFTVTNTSISLSPDCAYASGNPVVTLIKELDAESPYVLVCETTDDSKLFFEPLNINEFIPAPSRNTTPTVEVHVTENETPGEVLEIYYTDDDYGEAKDLNCIQTSSDYGDIFSLTPVLGVDVNSNIKTFKFSVKEKLDFEEQMLYRMTYDIVSTDGKNNTKSAKQTILVYVDDVPDTPPYWTQEVHAYSLEECREEDSLFTVQAMDGDPSANYAIRYSLEEESDYFKIDELTGLVSRKRTIDYEELSENGSTRFSLKIRATEYKEDGTEGEQPNSSQQVTTVTIVDCNDNVPTFDRSSYKVTMDELMEFSGGQDLDLDIVVTDPDQGINGSYTLTTSDPDRLSITPKEGQGHVSVTLTARSTGDGFNYFDYELHHDTMLTFTITATEEADPSHASNATVSITLLDLNDNAPVFSSPLYEESVKENVPQNTLLLVVEANDYDLSEEFGKPSIRYSLSSCSQIEVNSTTGAVTLITNLDYDSAYNNKIDCIVYAVDEYGHGLMGTSEIVINALDVVDEPPQFTVSDIEMAVEESSAIGHEVGRFTVEDLDEGANISFKIVSSICSRNESQKVDGWFTVVADSPDHPDYPAIVQVDDDIAYRTCSGVTLSVMATDLNTEENIDNANGTVSIIITDTNDPPAFKGNYDDLTMDEFSELDPPVDSVVVFQVTVSDPDVYDLVYLSISEGGDLVELSMDVVVVDANGEATVDVRTRKGVMIDRETQSTLEVEISIENPEQQNSSSKNFSVTINDLNDKVPTMTAELCDKFIHIPEDDGTMAMNGTVFYFINATDDDVQSPYNTISYMMVNDQLPEHRTPFTVDEKSGRVSVLLDEGRILDRELVDQWELYFIAFDHCRLPEDYNCKVLYSEMCKLTIIVDDINDNYPRDLTWQPDESITVTEALQKDEDLGYLLWAHDDDVGENAALSYSVVSTVRPPSDVEVDLFYAVDETVVDVTACRLFASQDFAGMDLRGEYTVVLQARDGGNRTTDFSIPITVTAPDGNTHAPYFQFDGCPGEDDTTIIMEENAYTPGENGRPTSMEVKCNGPDGLPFTIRVTDDDVSPVNRDVIVEIDRANSTVENTANEQAQLSYWSLEPKDCVPECHLLLSHRIDREQGTVYNLALHVRNTASPLMESWTTVRVGVTNVKEFDPYFCIEGNCSQTVYMFENDPDARATFIEATDLDNTNTSPDDPAYDRVYYFIVGGDSDYFTTISDTQPKIVLRDLPDGLDREERQSYSLAVIATNDPVGGGSNIDDMSSSNILHITILVGDVNDEAPTFPYDVILPSFMTTNKNGDRLAVIEADDLDLNETLTYTTLDDLQWFDADLTPENPFALEQRDSRSAYLVLAFNPSGMTRGHCNFTIRVEDGAGHRDRAQALIYLISEEYQVTMYFSNTVEDVTSKRYEIQDALTEAYGFYCNIYTITPTQTPSGETISNETTANMYFMGAHGPVEDTTIIDLSDDADVMDDLQQSLDLIGITLDSVEVFPELPSA